MKLRTVLSLLALMNTTLVSQATGTWVPLKNPPPHPVGHFLPMPDGTVMGIADPYAYGSMWLRLTPDKHGSYVNGTWSTNATMNFTRLDFDSLVLTNGKVLVAGGEYGTGLATAEIYDPVSNLWTTVPVPTGVLNPAVLSPQFNISQRFGDACAIMLASGKALFAPIGPNTAGGTVIFDPGTQTWANGPAALSQTYQWQVEASWVQLPDASVLTVDPRTTNSERYIPSLNTWIVDTNVPVSLYDVWGGELGPALLLPNGKAIFFGATTNTAIYTPSGNTNLGSWAAGPSFPNSQGMPDAPGAMMVNGKILLATCVAPYDVNIWYPPVSFYEYDYLSNSFTRVLAPSGSNTFNGALWPTLMADLPDGTVLFGHRSTDFYIYQPDGVPIAAGKPTLTSITTNVDGSLHLTGRLFNGISVGASYGDDEQMDSNFPLVRFTDTAGIIRYGRTYNWTGSGVMTGPKLMAVDCEIPAGASTLDNIQVVVNGFESGYNPIVVNTNDSGPGSLRQVITLVPSGSTITFAADLSGKTIVLTSGELLLTNNLTIDASALPAGIAIDGNHSNRVFEVAGGFTVTLDSLTLTNAYPGAGAWGGALANGGTCTLRRCTLTGNSVDSSTSSAGGAIHNYGTLTLSACTLYGNSGYSAACVRNDATCTLVNCTLANNTVPLNGGGIDNVFGTLTIKQCTFSGNSASTYGGGVDNYQGTVNVTNCILGGNSAGVAGPDIYNWASSTVNFGGTNLVQSNVNAGTNNGAGSIIAAAPQISPLANYGGPTKTMPPLTNSAALDGGADTAASGIATDQRGLTRLAGPHVDIGAVEVQPNPVVFNLADAGYGSFRYAATYMTNGATITFAPNLADQTILLTSGEVLLNKNLTIDGSALPGGITLDGNGTSRVLSIEFGSTVTLNSVRITHGNGVGASNPGFGGGIFSFGNLTLNDCWLVDNQAGATGGALASGFGSLTMNRTSVSSNLCGNVSAIYIQDQPAALTACTISGNSGANGDALRLNASSGSAALTLVNSTLSGNTVSGGVGAALTIQSSTGLSASAVLTNCTVASNVVVQAGQPGAIYLRPGGGTNTLDLYNSIVSGNTSGGAPGDITGTVSAGSAYNLVGAGGGLANSVNGNLVGVNNPQLAALGDNGGSTQTMPPLPTSPVIDAGGDLYLVGITHDQTGAPRIDGPHVDIGAVELPVGTVVLNTADSGYGSLRYLATYAADGANITFSAGLSGQTIMVTNGEVLLSKNLNFSALALPAGIVLDGNHANRLFEVPGGVAATLDSLTLINGFAGAGNWGGALQNGGTLIMNRCTIAGSSTDSSGSGGAVENYGTLLMRACTLSGNTAQFAGAMRNETSCTLINCTLAGNSAPANGGGIDNVYGALTLEQCTFSGNGASGFGGGVDNYLGIVNVTNCILGGNSAGAAGPDIYNWASSTVNFGGTNLVQSSGNDGTYNGAGTIIAAAPQLAALGNYGGPTQTMPPLAGSPAIDAGSDASASGIAADQRGYPRLSGAHVDIGAVEGVLNPAMSLINPVHLANGTVEFFFSNLSGPSYTVLASTNAAAPVNTWSNLGPAAETPPGSGHFQFTDLQATNYPQRFYSVTTP